MLSEDIEPNSHLIARNMITAVMLTNNYEVIPGYYINPKWTAGNPNRAVIPPEVKQEYYHEFDLRCRKWLDNGLVEKIYIDIGTEDDWDTLHSPMNTSKYVYHKQVGNDREAEEWLHRIDPDAIFIRPSKGEVIAIPEAEMLYNYIKKLSRKYVRDFIAEQSSSKF